MPDSTATDMPVPRPGPALSAVSDAPALDLNNAQETDIEEAARLEAEAKAKEGEPKEAKTDDTPPAVKAQITKERNRRRAAEEASTAAVARALAAEAEVERLKPKPAPVVSKPSRADFTDPDDYDAAMIAYGKNEAKREAAEEQATKRREAIDQEQRTLTESFRSSVEAFSADHPDFEDVFTEELPITIAMSHAIMSADNSAELAYWLGQNPDEAKRISGLSDVKAVYELGRISTKIAEPEARPERKAKPAPIRPLGSRSGEAGKDPAEMSTEEYATYRNAQLRGNGASAVH